ncbi:MAG: glycosyltransferase [Fibromonadaceae bacterium]|jgi:pyruvyl transferase EpsI|nr:glycosyltransferase [Fibromonadaceae bacterium]
MKPNDPLVSWLMPVYNGEKYLRRAMDSMLGQTYQNFIMIIIIENGCIDNTEAICEEYAKKDKRIRIYYNKENLGVAASLNRGLELCEGKYIARMDAGDVSLPERLEKQVAFMENNLDIGVLGTYCQVIRDSYTCIAEPPIGNDDICAKLIFVNTIMHPSVMLRSGLFKLNNWKYPEGESEDYALWASLISKTKMANLADVLVEYYEHGDNACSVKFPKIRAVSADISRKALFDELNINTSNYPDIYFGWRGYDLLPYDIKKFLVNGAKLLSEIKIANNKLQKFNDKSLNNVLEAQWQQTKCDVRLSSLKLKFDELISEVVDDAMSLFADKKVIIYGTGRYCSNVIDSIKNDEFFSNIIAFCDSDKSKHNTDFFGKKIIVLEQLSNFDYDYILIASPLYEQEIRNMLNSIKIPSQKILTLPSVGEFDFHLKRKKYDKYYAHKNTERKAYLFCTPDYGNLGDHAIAEATYSFFQNQLGFEIAEIPFGQYNICAEITKHHILPSDIVLITGGGFLGSLWFSAEQQARDVIKNYPDNPIIILPQSIFWENTPRWKKECEETQQVYASHGNLTLCARDLATYKLMQELYPTCHLRLIPDMALYMNWNNFFDTDTQRNGALLCLKKDKESILTDENQQYLLDIGKKLCGDAKFCTTVLQVQIFQEERENRLRKKINEFRKAELVVTDRLHGMIFAAIAETPCVVLSALTHKLQATFEWVKHLPYIRFAENIADVKTFASQVLAVEVRKYETARLESYFDELEALIKGL